MKQGFSLYATLATTSLSFLIAGVGFYSFSNIQHAPNTQVSLVACTYREQPPTTVAKAVYVEDVTTGSVLEEKNAYAQLPLASLTKIMTASVALDSLDPKDVVVIPEEAFSVGSTSGLFADERWTVGDLLGYTLITSSNEGAHALALIASQKDVETHDSFIRKMNEKAQSIDLISTYFINDTGLDVSTTTAGAYGSAYDVAQLLLFASKEHPDIMSFSTHKEIDFVSLSGFVHTAKHTSTITGNIAGNTIAKTGYTDLAGGNLGVIVEPVLGRPVVIVVLGSTREDRDDDVLALSHYAKRVMVKDVLCGASQKVAVFNDI
ncbi:hypothetical protein COU15_00205 [Candidatus Kaiserbacteria bacterium CG10_big_fil_rev_8_21_14_0_10_45_20]|uniref:Peptidase S11 D-alanyl-D-alanine carboxypeptidase A N-terminal domain-containing protein n=1 Tax=Candidatus Kaiserbacteria bacterium CG10_big_fil_rev_8_21_14_0_10_45_20 TaxID=1974607 RepID=A0A2H0UGF8_9BACT|nr:MAG: hypothetical protein COU15_00205 [Candidatus Kaiserbacteria bacterium CG10_big_fil_rev_8_21_14_0_10_45_20]